MTTPAFRSGAVFRRSSRQRGTLLLLLGIGARAKSAPPIGETRSKTAGGTRARTAGRFFSKTAGGVRATGSRKRS